MGRESYSRNPINYNPIWKIGYQKSISFANLLNIRQSLSRKNLILPIRNVLVTDVKG